MNTPRKICVVTGTRAEYGLLRWLIHEIHERESLCLQLVATGMHLSPEFGLTYQQIEADGYAIDAKVDMQLTSDTAAGITRSMGIGLMGFAETFEALAPDLVVVLGDRFEILVAAQAACMARIPIAHLHGGELTEGAYDDAFRHAITKLSTLHFTSTSAYRNRVIQLGEAPARVFHVGALANENLFRTELMDQTACEDSIDFKLGERNLLVTFHPETLAHQSSEQQFSELLAALDEFPDIKLIITHPNADTDGRVIIRMIESYAEQNPDRVCSYVSLGQLRYLSALNLVDGMVGNSSSGIIEAPSFKIGTINIGDRQRGRIAGESVIHCDCTKAAICDAIERLYSEDFQKTLATSVNPYAAEPPVAAIVDVLESISLESLANKQFYDLNPD